MPGQPPYKKLTDAYVSLFCIMVFILLYFNLWAKRQPGFPWNPNKAIR